jgi:hypothetical protein
MTNDEVGLVTWHNNFTIANGSAVLTDGAKRDRLIWPGDMAIAVPAIVASYYDIESIEDSLDSLYSLQNDSTGQLPYAGIPFTERGLQSDTYHLYSLIGVADHFLYTGKISIALSVPRRTFTDLRFKAILLTFKASGISGLLV